MKRQVGRLSAEVTQGEVERFTVPMLLVHGLWSDETAWRNFSSYLTNRGWTCVAVRLRGRDGADVGGVEEHLDDVRSAIASLASPPVIAGHDLGALLGFGLCEQAAAVVGLAPLVPAPLGNLGNLPAADGLLARLRGGRIPAPRGRLAGAYAPGGSALHESAAVLRELRQRLWSPTVPAKPVPSLIVAGARDPLTGPDAARRLADHVGAEFDLDPTGGHALVSEPGWEERVSRVHRWLVKRLGASLLALYEEPER